MVKNRSGGTEYSSTEAPRKLFVWSLALLFCGRWNISPQNLAYEALFWSTFWKRKNTSLPTVMCQRVIEKTFGILAARCRIYHSPIIASIKNAEGYVLATIAPHNYLRLTDNAVYTPVGFVDSQALSGEIRPGKWRRILDDVGGMSSVPNVRG